MKFIKTVVQVGILYSAATFATAFSIYAATEAWENRDEIVESMKNKAGQLYNKIRKEEE